MLTDADIAVVLKMLRQSTSKSVLILKKREKEKGVNCDLYYSGICGSCIDSLQTFAG